jgi:ribosome modulation factor
MNPKLRTAVLAATAMLACGSTVVLAQGPPPPPPGYGYQQAEPWAAPPSEYNDEVRQRGFHDGIEGARKDYQNHRTANVENRDEYRHPPVHHDKDAYRDAFRRGYQVGVEHIMNGASR